MPCLVPCLSPLVMEFLTAVLGLSWSFNPLTSAFQVHRRATPPPAGGSRTTHACAVLYLVACRLFSGPPVGTVILSVTPPASFLAAKLPLVHSARLSHAEDEAGLSVSSVGTHPSLPGLTCREFAETAAFPVLPTRGRRERERRRLLVRSLSL